MEIIKYLGDKLAQKIGISPPAARGLLKLSIKDELGPFNPLDKLNFIDLKKVLQKSLNQRLIRLGVSDNQKIVEFMLSELTNNQSLITMAGV
ncbi:MAG: hypothetical protein EU539_02790 [Promethearchaeota archaeon]|nr:MAG: hypothetical protein EU539_02790 [Candidatus Lokiarchaeota archaeon]